MGSQPVAGTKILIEIPIEQAKNALRDLKAAGSDTAKTFEGVLGSSIDSTSKKIKRLADDIGGGKATRGLQDLEKVVEQLGGVSKLSDAAIANLTTRITALKAAGGQTTATLEAVTQRAQALNSALAGSLGAQANGGISALASSLGPLGSSLAALGPVGLGAAAAIGGVALVGGGAAKVMADLAMTAANYGDKIKDMSTTTGIGVEAVQQLAHAAAVTDTPLEKVTGAIVKMQRALVDSPAKFEELGLSLEKLTAMSPDEQLQAVAEALMKIEDPAKRNAIAVELFGKSWAELAPFMTDGLAAMKDAVVLSKETIDALDDLKTKANLLGGAWEKMVIAIGATIATAPGVSDSIDMMSQAMDRLTRMAQGGGGALKPWVSNLAGFASTVGAQLVNWTGAALFEGGTEPIGATSKGSLSGGAGGGKDRNEFTREAIRLERELQQAIAGTATGLDAAIAEIDASTKAKIAEIQANEKLTASEKGRLTALAAAAGEAEKKEARAAVAQEAHKQAVVLLAEAEKDRNATITAGMSALDQELTKIEAARRAKEDAARTTLAEAEANHKATDELRHAVQVRIDEANAYAKQAAAQAKLVSQRQLEANSTQLVNRAEQEYLNTVRRGDDSLKNQVASIEAKRDASIDAAQAEFDAGKITADALQEAIRLYRLTADEAIRYARVLDTIRQLSGAANVANALGGALNTMGLTSAGNLAGHVGTGLGQTAQFIQAQSRGDTAGMASSGLGMIGNIWSTGQEHGALLGGLAGGAQGAAVGAQLGGPYGAVIGGVAGAALGVAGSIFGGGEEKHVQEMRDRLIEARGGMHAFGEEAARAGVTLEHLFDAKTVDDYNAAIQELDAAMDPLTQAHEKLNEAIQRYGFTVSELGPQMQAQQLQGQFEQLYTDWQLLTASGIDHEAVIRRMGPALQEYVNNATASGAAIPEALRPALQSMVDMGTLTDAAGNKMDSLEGLTFAQTLSEDVRDVVHAVQDLVDALNGVPNIERTLTVKKITVSDGGSGGVGGSVVPDDYEPPEDMSAAAGMYAASMPRGRWKDGGTLLMVHPGEEVFVNPNGAGSLGAGLPAMGGGRGGNDRMQMEILGTLQRIERGLERRDETLPKSFRDALAS